MAERHRSGARADKPHDLFDLLLAAHDPETGQAFSPAQLRDQAATMILADCEQEAAEAVALLDRFNESVAFASEPAALAMASPETCKWCPYKLICPAFWANASPNWSGMLDGSAVEGVCVAPQPIHNGAAIALSIEVELGSEPRGRMQIAPLNPSVHTALAVLAAGRRARLVGLRARTDGTLSPTARTVVVDLESLPAVRVKLA